MTTNRMLQIIALTVLLATLTAAAASAQSFDVTLNTSPLSGTQTLAFGFTDGDGLGNNSATLTAFNFGGGGALGSPTDFGTGISGDLTSGIALNDSDFSSLFTQQFTAGSSLSFLLNITDNFAGGTPDAFAMYVCDASLTTCYSDDMASGAMLVLNLSGGPLAPGNFILNGASDQDLSAPVVTVPSVPEPSTLLLWATGLAALFGAKKIWG
jgi:hypothetical protein